MSEIINSRKISDLHPYVMNLCKQHIINCSKRGVKIMVTDVMRSDSYQQKLYNQGRTTKGQIVTWTKTTYAHGMYDYNGQPKSMAYDVAPLTDDGKKTDYGNRTKWKVIIEEGKKLGLEHGTDVFGKPDDPHFQLVEGLSKAELKSGKRPSYWNDKPTHTKPQPKQSPYEILQSKGIINKVGFDWQEACEENHQINGLYMKALINNYYKYKTKEWSFTFTQALQYLLDDKIISDIAPWLMWCQPNEKVSGQYAKIVISRMSEKL
jgi:peptidoglycan L-alanyl-D-glutamate endopeptidase CwlK